MSTSWKRLKLLIVQIIIMLLPTTLLAASPEKSAITTIRPTVIHNLFIKARHNKDWKLAFLTGKNAQIVFMNVSQKTNPKNEIGMEKHPFDQVILIAQGKAKVDLAGKISKVRTGDMIFIPQGTLHNVINLNPKNPLKIISVYSDRDIPAHSKFKNKRDEH